MYQHCYRRSSIYSSFYISPTSVVICGRRISRRKPSVILALIVTFLLCVVCWQISDDRLLREITGGPAYLPPPISTDCDIAVAMGSDMSSTRGMFASINSIITNYKNDEKSLCFFVFSTKEDFAERERGLKCAFGSGDAGSLPKNVRIFNREIQRGQWEGEDNESVIFTPEEAAEGVVGGGQRMEYTYARYYLKPEHVDGVQRVIWIDSDTIVQGNIEEIYNWDLHGQVVAGTNYWQPLKDYLCTNPRLGRIKMRTPDGKRSPLEVKQNLNNGLLVMDLYEMQRQRIIEKWNKLLKLHMEDCLWTHSDKAFNLVIRGRYAQLPQEWNIGYLGTQELHRYVGACQKAKMLHWNGIGKPYTIEGRSAALCVDHFDAYDVIALQNKGQCLSGS